MISIFQHQLQRLVLAKPSDTEVEPVLWVRVAADICVALDFDGEGVVGGDIGVAEIASREAAIDNDIVIKVDIVSIGMPQSLFLLT